MLGLYISLPGDGDDDDDGDEADKYMVLAKMIIICTSFDKRPNKI